jgi:hypothetical protein
MTIKTQSDTRRAAMAARKQVKPQEKAPREKSIARSDRAIMQRTSAPVAKSMTVKSAKPRQEARLNGDVMIRHREYIADIAGSVAFATTQFSINPGLSSTFPWLSSLAPRWESYRLEKLRLCYETEAASTALGTVLLSVDYDASDPAPTSKSQAMAYRSSVRSAPWSNCCHDSLREDLIKKAPYFVRSGALSANQDVKLYDVANLFVCTQGQADTTVVGELYIEYDVLLMTPQLSDLSVGQSLYGEWSNAAGSNAAPFGNTELGNLQAVLVSTGTTTSVTAITFTNPFSGQLSYQVTGTGISTPAIGGTATRKNSHATPDGTGVTGIGIVSFVAAAGQTIDVNVDNTTLTSGILMISQGSFT